MNLANILDSYLHLFSIFESLSVHLKARGVRFEPVTLWRRRPKTLIFFWFARAFLTFLFPLPSLLHVVQRLFDRRFVKDTFRFETLMKISRSFLKRP